MTQDNAIKNFKANHSLGKIGNVPAVNIALNKITRDTGEDEYGPLFLLKEEFRIKVKFKEIRELRGRYIWVWVIRPFNKNFFQFLERKLKKLNLPLLDYLKVLHFNNNKTIKYPEKVEMCRVHKEIFEILKEQHNINSSFLSYYEWNQVQNSKTWIKTQIQITREFIADKLLKKNIIV